MPDGRRFVSASQDRTLRLWDSESEGEIAIYTADSAISECSSAQYGGTIVARDASGQAHFLRLIEADSTKPQTGDTKFPLLFREQQSLDKPKKVERWRFWKWLWGRSS